MNATTPSIRVNVDVTNPGQFFACCGLLELADRLWPDSSMLGAFTPKHFHIFSDSSECSLKQIVDCFVNAEVQQLDIHNSAASPLCLGKPFDLRLDWWQKVKTSDNQQI